MARPWRTTVRLVATALTVAAVASACHSTTNPPPHSTPAPNLIGPKAVRIHGPIHTQGAQILDATGQVVRFNGVGVRNYVTVGTTVGSPGAGSVATPSSPCVTAPSQREVDDIANWGFNSVRIPLAWANLEPLAPTVGADGTVSHAWDSAYLANLDRFVQLITSRGLAVMFTVHTKFGASDAKGPCNASSVPSWLYPDGIGDPSQARCDFLTGTTQPGAPEPIWDGFQAMWGMLAARYADNSQVVAADLLNEPYPASPCNPSDTKLSDLYERLGRAVRAVNPAMALIIEDSPPGLALKGKFEISAPPPLENVIYSFHLYQANWSPDGLAVNNAYRERALAWNVPLFVGEFNAFGYAAPGAGFEDNWQSETIAALTYWKAHKIGWMAWAYSGGNHLINQDGSPRADLVSTFQKGF